MKSFLMFTLVLVTGAWLTAADLADATFIGHDKMEAALNNKGDIHLLAAGNLMVEGNYRNKAGVPELHDKLTDIFYITEGSATFVTGGTMEGGKTIGPGQVRGVNIQGGQTHHLVKGDTIVIPAGIPHWFKEVPGEVKYFVVKVVKQ